MAVTHVHTELVEVREASSRLMIICMNHLTSSAVNIIDEEMGLALARAVMKAEWYVENELINGVVLCSGKHQSFLAGADLLYEQKITTKVRGFSAAHAFGSVVCKLESLDIPTFAVINGAALGGGLELILGCDFRVADEKHCSQLGLPEVKLGVLPGAGGCMRLPLMLGLSVALDLLLSGKQIDAKRALRCGLVDQLFSATQSIKTGHDTNGSYQYQWLPKLTTCLKARKIGKRKFTLKQISNDSVLLVENKVPDFTHVTEKSLEKSMDWAKCNAKYFKKFPIPLFRNCWLEQQVKYWLAQRSILKQIGKRMASPYQCLLTTMACLNAANCHEAVEINAQGFAELVVTAESKCLMGLFLELRYAKKAALSYGELSAGFSKEKSLIVIPLNAACCSESKQAACFAQCAIHSGIEVVFAYSQQPPSTEEVSTIVTVIRDQFQYLVDKGRMTFKEVSDKLGQLLSFHSLEQIVAGIEFVDLVFVMDFTQTSTLLHDAAPKEVQEELDTTNLRAALHSNNKVVCVASNTGLGSDCNNEVGVVNINTFYPLDRLTTMVEVFPSNSQVAMDVCLVAALINAMGKTPIVINFDQQLSVMNFMLISFWSCVAKLFFCGHENVRDVHRIDQMIGFSPGPFQVMDEIGLPCVLGLAQQAQSTGHECNHLVQLLQPLIAAGHTGKTCGKGFYVWIDGKPLVPSGVITDIAEKGFLGIKLSLLAAIETSNRVPDVNHSLLDLLCVSGLISFPPQEGGPFHYLYRNPKLFSSIDDDLVVVRDPDASYSSMMLVKEVEAVGPCHGMMPLPTMVPGYTPNIVTLLLLLTMVIMIFVFLIFAYK